jgi:tetratricopeptide (TPR) repeat protein
MAAKRATGVYAYGEAVRLLEQALNVQRVLNPDDKEKICDLLLDLCDALFDVPDVRRIHETEAPEAFSLAESINDGARAAKVCSCALQAFGNERGFGAYLSPEVELWIERADRYAETNTVERIWADFYLAISRLIAGETQSSLRYATQALETARRIGTPEALSMPAFYIIQYRSAPQHTKERAELAEELWADKDKRHKIVGTSAGWVVFGGIFLATGQRQHAEEVFDDLHAITDRTGNTRLKMQSLGMDAVLMLIDGRFDDVDKMTENIRTLGEEAGIPGVITIYASHPGVRADIYRGKSLEDRERGVPRGIAVMLPELCLLQAHLGMNERVAEILEEEVVKRPGIGTLEDETRFWYDTLYLESATLLGHRKVAELLLNRLSGTGLYTTGISFPTCIIRHLGGAAALLERYDEARKYYLEAIKVCTQIRFRPELALTRLQLAELLLEQYPEEKREALEHLNFAIKEFREMKMQPSLERALRHKDILKA